jgi:DNA-binding transcriptional LysR family regulator
VDTAWLEIFREVARRGSLTAAATALGYTQSAVSRQIAALERDTGTRLFDRLARGMRLTDDGRCLLGHAEAVLDRLETARGDLAALRTLDAGRLRVGAFDTAEAALLPRALAAFRAEHPRVVLSLTEANTPDLLAALTAGDLDLAIVSVYPGAEAIDETRYALRLLAEDPLLVAFPKGHPRAGAGRRLRLADLAAESWIEGNPAGASTLVTACLRAGFRPRVDFPVREWTAKQGFVAAGLGLALVPRLGASAARPDIVLVPLTPEDAPVRTVYAATARQGGAAPAVTAFVPHLVDAARRLAR